MLVKLFKDAELFRGKTTLTAIRAFKDISNDNAPHDEHDFGSFSSTVKQSSGKLRITTIA